MKLQIQPNIYALSLMTDVLDNIISSIPIPTAKSALYNSRDTE